MKKKNYEHSKIRYRLNQAKAQGKKVVYWKLDKEEAEFIKVRLNKKIRPDTFKIRVKKIMGNYSEFPEIIKIVEQKSRGCKETFSMPLTSKEKNILNKYGIKFYPDRYEIVL